MTTKMTAENIVLRLNRSQLRTVLALDKVGSVLGCSEQTAIRLQRATTKRPALIAKEFSDDGPLYSLNVFGLAVKSAALKMGHSL